jgi:hypothetical protein
MRRRASRGEVPMEETRGLWSNLDRDVHGSQMECRCGGEVHGQPPLRLEFRKCCPAAR